MDPRRRVGASAFPRPDDEVDTPGLYAWFIDSGGAEQLSAGLGALVASGLVYAGQAGAGLSSATLRSRISGNHLGGNISGSTLRYSLAAILATEFDFTRNSRTLDGDGEARLSSWMRQHLSVAVATVPGRGEVQLFEARMLVELDPPLNLQGMRASPVRTALRRKRRELVGGKASPRRSRPRIPARITQPPAPSGPAPDMGAFLIGLVGQTIPTFTGRPNHILRVEFGYVYVATNRSPGGQPVEISRVQAAANRLLEDGHLRIDVPTVGHRSAFVGAVLQKLPSVHALTNPRRLVLIGVPGSEAAPSH